MDIELKLELLKLADKNIRLGVEVIELVTMNDSERGTFYGRTVAEYIRDALDGTNSLEIYLRDIESEKDSAPVEEMSWTGVELEPGYVAIPSGMKLKLGDHIYVREQWQTFEQAYGDRGLILIGFTYRGNKFLASRLETELEKDKGPVTPQGYRRLEKGEKIRLTDEAWTQKDTWAQFNTLNKEANDMVGKPLDPTKLFAVIRRLPNKPKEQGGTPIPLAGFRELVVGEPIQATDLIYHLRVWMPVIAPVVTKEFNALVGILHDPNKHFITRKMNELLLVEPND